MQTLQSTLKLGRDVWDSQALPHAEFEGRLDLVRDLMRSRDLDLMLLYGRGLDHCGHPTYLSHYTVKLPVAAMVVVPDAGGPVLLFQGASRGLPAAKATTWMNDVHACGDVARATAALLRERAWTPRAVGIAGVDQHMPHDGRRLLIESLADARVVDVDDAVYAIRAIKSAREQEQVRRAGRLLAHTLGALSRARVGFSSERSIEATLIRDARLGGAEDVKVMLARPSEDDGFRPAEEIPVADGTIIVNLSVSLDRYWAQACRTFGTAAGRVVAQPTPALDAEATRRLALLRQGLTMADIAAMGPPTRRMNCTRCHGIGLEAEEPPGLESRSSVVVAPGMCLVVRTALDDETYGPVERADTVIIGVSGVEVVTPNPS